MRLVSRPVLCNYYITYRCNASCAFCDIWERPSPYVTLDNVRENLIHLKKLGVKVIDFTGGEPLLHRQLPEMLHLAKQEGFITTITTNALLYPKYAEKLRGKVDMLHFSLDSPIKEEHDKSRGVACFDFVTKSIQIAQELGEKPDILFTVFAQNIHQIEQVYQEITLPNGLVLILNPVFEYNDIAIEGNLSTEDLKTLRKWGKKRLVYLNGAFVQLRLDGGNHTDKPVCKAGSATVVISPENKLILPCYHLGLEEFPIENNLYELYHSQPVQKLVALEGKHEKCEGCAINCYMQPSFAVHVNKYFWLALPSTLRYNYWKGTWKNLL